MGDCTNKNIGRHIDRYLLDLLSAQDTEQFERHILECDFCASELAQFNEVSANLLHSKTIQAEVENIVSAEEEPISAQDQSRQVGKPTPWWKRRMVWAAAAVLIILLFKPWKIDIAPSDEVFAGDNRIAILPINTLEPNDNWLGDAATNLLITNLSESDQLTILTTQRVKNVLEYLDMEKIMEFDADLAVRVAEKADANWVIIGKIDQTDPELAINVILLNVVTGDTVTNRYLTGRATDDLFSIIDKMTDTVKTNILQDRNIAQSRAHSVADITTRSPEAYRQYLKGVSLIDQLYHNEAESCFVKAISYDSTYAMAYYYLAFISDNKHIENALKYINRSSRWEQYYIKALASLINKDTDGFFNEIEKLIKDFPFDAKAYYWYAQIRNNMRDEREALDYYYRTIEIDPYYKLAYNSMCYIFLNKGDYKKALWANDMYIAISPNEANPYDTRGDIFSEMGEFEKAIESYLKALEIKPFFSYTYSKLCVMYQLTRNFDQARHWYNRGWSNEHDKPFPPNITAEMFVAEGKFEKAIETLDEALPLVKQGIMKYTSIEDIMLFKAQILAEKEPLLSIQEMEKISIPEDTLLDFQRTDYYFLFTRLFNKLGHFQKADSSLKKLEQDIDTTIITQYRYYLIAGDINLQRQLYKDAIFHLQRARDIIGPNHDFDSRYLLSIAYVESGRFAEAVSELILQLKNNNYRRTQLPIWNAKMHYYLGRAYEGLEKYQLASEQYEYFLEIWKDADWKIKEIEDSRVRLASLKNVI